MEMNLPLTLPFILLLLGVLMLCSFFFSSSETAIIGLNKIRLRHLVAKGIKRAQGLQRLITKLDDLIVAILIGNSFVNIAISAIVTAIFVGRFGQRWGIIIATFTTTLFVLIFCEIIPKIFASKHTEKLALLVAPYMSAFIKIFHPFIHIFTGIANSILRFFGMKPGKRLPLVSEEELKLLIEIGKEEGVLTDEERKMLHRIFEFGDTKVQDVMVPKDKIVTIDVKSTPEQLLNLLVEEGHARIPVFKDTKDNIIGVIYARDLLYILKNGKLFVIEDLIYPAYFIPLHKRVNELLREFQLKKIQIAIIVDENKKALGLVTLEDLIEEIVGEIDEEVKK